MCFDIELVQLAGRCQSFNNRFVYKFIYVTKADDGRMCLIGNNTDGRNCEMKAFSYFPLHFTEKPAHSYPYKGILLNPDNSTN